MCNKDLSHVVMAAACVRNRKGDSVLCASVRKSGGFLHAANL